MKTATTPKLIQMNKCPAESRVTSTELEYMVAVRDFCKAAGDEFINIAPLPGDHSDLFVVRVFKGNKLIDRLIRAYTHRPCEVIESKVIDTFD